MNVNSYTWTKIHSIGINIIFYRDSFRNTSNIDLQTVFTWCPSLYFFKLFNKIRDIIIS